MAARRPFIPALTGIRFVAAGLVLLGHAATLYPSHAHWTIVAFCMEQITSGGMSIFFVLSGFVIWVNYADIFTTRISTAGLRDFLAARFARLYPMYLFTIILALAMGGLSPLYHRAPFSLFTIVMLQAWLPGGDGSLAVFSLPWIGHLWSVSTEVFFYLLFPGFVLVFSRFGRKASMGMAVLNVAALCLAFYLAFRIGPSLLAPIEGRIGGTGMQWLTYYAPYLHVFEFIAGCLAGHRFMSGAPAPLKRGSCAAILLGFLCMPIPFILIRHHPEYANLLACGGRVGAMIFVAMALPVISGHETWLSRALSSRVMLFGGECSYSIYLLHPILLRLFVFGPDSDPGLAAFLFRLVVIVVAVTALAWGTYIIIEAPGRTYLRKLLRKERPSPLSFPASAD